MTSSATTWRVDVHVIPMAHPADWSGLEQRIADGAIRPAEIVAVFGKTEGNGCVNDFTRAYASQTLGQLLTDRYGLGAASGGLGGAPEAARDAALGGLGRARALADQSTSVAPRPPVIVISGGTEGALSPHATVFVRRAVEAPPTDGGALMVAATHTAELPPEHLGRRPQVDMVAEAVRRLMVESEMAANQVAFVQVKCPLLTAARVLEARARGHATATTDTYKSMALSRAASALGVAVALGEVAADRIDDRAIGHDWSLYSRVASTSSGVELANHEVCLLGTSRQATGPLRIGRAVMEHPLDQAALARALRDAGAPNDRVAADLVQILAKAEAPPDGTLLGARHTMLDDSDIPHSRMARAIVGAVLSAAAGRTHIYVSGGAEHQGPPGGGPLAAIVRAS